jgi:hypothetical protein
MWDKSSLAFERPQYAGPGTKQEVATQKGDQKRERANLLHILFLKNADEQRKEPKEVTSGLLATNAEWRIVLIH